MGLGESVKKGIEIVKLNGTVMEEVAKTPALTGMGVLIIVLAGVAYAIGSLNLVGIILFPISFIIGTFIGFGIFHLLALLFGGKAKFGEFYRTMSHSYVLYWVSVIPVIGIFLAGLVGLWELVVTVFALKNVHQLSTAKAIIVLLIPVIIGIIIGVAVGVALMAAFLGGMAAT